MPAAYVVLSHTGPDQVTRLVRAIRRSSPDASVFVMHDERSETAPVVDDPRVHVRTHGRATDWGSWELVEVTLDGLRWARETIDPDLTVLVSGQCYPVRPLASWERELLVAGGGWQGTARPLDYTPAWGRRPGRGDDRLTRYTYRWFQVPFLERPLRSGRTVGRALWGVSHRLEPVVSLRMVERGRGAYLGLRRPSTVRRSAPRLHLGSQWLALDRELMGTVLRELAPGAPLRRNFERSVIPDESALQTVLARVRPPTIDVAVSHSVWLPDEDTTRTFAIDDLDEVIASGSPFCRKVHPMASAELLDALDRVNGVERGRR